MSEKRKIQPGQEIEVGIVNGWRCLVWRSGSGGVSGVLWRRFNLSRRRRRGELQPSFRTWHRAGEVAAAVWSRFVRASGSIAGIQRGSSIPTTDRETFGL
jgi:hypothetical protein